MATMARASGALWDRLLVTTIYGANTGVGKTVFSTLLGKHLQAKAGSEQWNTIYIKPVSTGPDNEADDIYFHKHTGTKVNTLYKYKRAVSPHLAAALENSIPSDTSVVSLLQQTLAKEARKFSDASHNRNMAIVETAGGVLSPGPSGTPQADLYRPLRLPTLLVADRRLGGIAATISAAESLILRGYEIDGVIGFNDGEQYQNGQYLQPYFAERGISYYDLDWLPDLEGLSNVKEQEKMTQYYNTQSRTPGMHEIVERLVEQHNTRLQHLSSLASRTHKVIWHPFTQHKHVEKASDILTIDSASGDFFQLKHTPATVQDLDASETQPLLYPAFDGSASWWTQGLGHGDPGLALAAAYAAGRYGHVMFAGATHQPALTLAEQLLEGMENPRLAKCFYTDDGSTAVEVGLKMGLRASCKRYGWDGSFEDVGILGLKGSYHGDTIGAMDASEPCVYNKKVDWYRGRGHWFDYPTVRLRKGKWVVEPPVGMEDDFGSGQEFEKLGEVFHLASEGRGVQYKKYIRKTLDHLVKEEGMKFGALIMEPLILGAGGMIFVDPIFQRTLSEVVRSYTFAPTVESPTQKADPNSWSGLPIIFDEVFTGLYRLGHFTPSKQLSVNPDISVHAKLLTGGLLPLSVTLASNSIFDAFLGNEKADALLHGHSYTAHAVGCHVATTSLDRMKELHLGEKWNSYRKDWLDVGKEPSPPSPSASSPTPKSAQADFWSMWDRTLVHHLSHHQSVDHVIALGSVLAVSLKDAQGSGYTSTAAISLRDALLLPDAENPRGVHSRVLGNVIYLMASLTSRPETLSDVLKTFVRKLDLVSN